MRNYLKSHSEMHVPKTESLCKCNTQCVLKANEPIGTIVNQMLTCNGISLHLEGSVQE